MINPQLLALIAQVLQSMPRQMAMRGPSARPMVEPMASGAHSRPAPASSTALVPATSTAGGHRPLPHMDMGPSSASSAYMSVARGMPTAGSRMGKMTFSNMTHGKGAGNFGMA